MKREFKIEIAGICISIATNSPKLTAYLLGNYRNYLSEKKPLISVDVRITKNNMLNKPSTAGADIKKNRLIIRDEHLTGKIDINRKIGCVIISAKYINNGIDIFLKNVFTLLVLKKYNGIAQHAAGILRNDRVYIFAGPSRSGKTTVSRFSIRKGYSVINDDLVIMRPVQGMFCVFPTPSWLHMQKGNIENKPYRIGGIFKLKKDKRVYLKKLSRGKATAEILTMPIGLKGFTKNGEILNRFSDIARNHNVYELHFKKDESFWKCIQ